MSRTAYSAVKPRPDNQMQAHIERQFLRNPEAQMDLYVLKTWIQAKLNIADERGASMVEYGLLLALIAVIAIVAVKALGTGVSTKFNDVNNSLN